MMEQQVRLIERQARFPAVSRFLHWLMAVMVLSMLFIGIAMVATESNRYHVLVSIHKPLGIAILEHAKSLGIGFAKFCSLGNKAQVSLNDLLEIWRTDADTKIVSSQGINVIRLPEHYGLLSPIIHVVPLQLLAYHTALARGTDVDKPRNLAKSVTVE